ATTLLKQRSADRGGAVAELEDPDAIVAVVVWEQTLRDGTDMTAAFATEAIERGLDVIEVDTRDLSTNFGDC
ncbi:MAG: hypothetical protein ACRDJC_23550, partial [Thermomicrobiales bacterium]